jgi:hypothetical protein
MDIEKIEQQKNAGEQLRGRSLQERGDLIIAACRAAAEIERGKIASGRPPSQPAPWPESTWEWLRRFAQRGKQRPTTD